MSIAEATPDLEHEDRNDRAFLGHPKGLGYLAVVEGCELAPFVERYDAYACSVPTPTGG